MAEHSKLPWSVNVYGDIVDAVGNCVDTNPRLFANPYNQDKARANAALIVRAVNDREEILAALERVTRAMSVFSISLIERERKALDDAKSVLSKARGDTP